MILLVWAFLVCVVVVKRRTGGAAFVFGYAWLACLTPIALGWLQYDCLCGLEADLAGFLLLCFASFLSGAALGGRHAVSSRARMDSDKEMAQALPWAKTAWRVGLAGTCMLCIDYALMGGAGLDDLAELRAVYQSRDVTLFARLGSVMTWGCLGSYAFALTYRRHLTARGFAWYAIPVIGYFMVALFSAGRQAALQIALYTIFLGVLSRARGVGSGRGKSPGGWWGIAIILSMVIYMAIVAVLRNDGLIDRDKGQVILRLFDVRLVAWLDDFLGWLGGSVRSAIIEGVVYFSSSIALFARFNASDVASHTFGAMSFPFVMRQLEPLTGISVSGALDAKIVMMHGSGVIGVGWTTGISSYVLDFGRIGACLVLFLQGFYSAFAWRRALLQGGFHAVVIAVTLMTSVCYLPFLAATAETNLLFLWVFSCAGLWVNRIRHEASAGHQ